MKAKSIIIIYLLIRHSPGRWIQAIMYHTHCSIMKKIIKYIFIIIC